MPVSEQIWNRLPDAVQQGLKTFNWRRALLIVGVGVVLIAVLGFLAAPPLVRSVLQEQASKALGRQVSVAKVRINPFALSVTLEGLRIAEQDGKGDFVSLGSVYANAELSSLFRRGLVLSALQLHEPELHIVRLADNRFNFSDILERLAAQPKEPSSEPPRFALNNIEIENGRIDFDDAAVGQKHVIDQLTLGLPFVSSMPSQVEILVKPHLETRVNGKDFALQGQLKPFADRREASLELQLEGFDLVRYLGYVPVALPVKIPQATLDAKLESVWTEHDKGEPSFTLRGDVALSAVRVTERDDKPLLAFKELRLGLQDVQPLANPMRIALRSANLIEPELDVHRFADGSLNLQRLVTKAPATATASAAAASAPAASNSASKSPLLTVSEITLSKARVRLDDEAVEGGFKHDITPVEVQIREFDLAGARDAQLKADLQLESSGKLGVQGSFNAGKRTADVRVTVDALPIERYHPYYAFAMGAAKPTGLLGVSARMQVSPPKAPTETGLRMSETALSVQDLLLPATASMAEPKRRGKGREPQPLLTLKTFALTGATIDVDKRDILLDQISSSDAQLNVERAADGKIDLLEALSAGTPKERADKPEMAPLTAEVASTAGEWKVRSGKVDISKWNVQATDRTGKNPVRLSIANLALKAEGFSNAKGSKGKFELGAELNRKGRINLAGQAAVAPLAGEVKVDARSVDLVFTQPYLSSMLRVLLTQGTLDARGTAAFDMTNAQTPHFSYEGDLSVSNLNSFDQINDADFLRWKSFALKRVKARSEPLALSIGDLRLDDFYTRLILDSQGRFNLREMTRQEEEALSSPAVAANAPGSSASSSVAAAARPLDIRVGRATFSGGAINFSDRFIKPNYDANLTDVAGSLSGLSPDPDSLAELSLKALVDRSAPVDVSGQLNPLRQDKYLDIKAKVTGVDLTGVSPYAARYVGYGISKGKLSMDVNYRIRDRKLTAENKVFLDQLTFGERVESPDATKLPVLLAVSLLKDRNGVIDLNMPISGTLDDPEFSVGGIILRVLVNLVTKAVTAPFALLGSMFGGGEELSYLDFNAGLATLSKPAEEKLSTLTRALTDRPALSLEITGSADPVADVAGLKQASLNSRLRALKAEMMVRRGESVGEVDALAIKPEEYPELLERVYRSASFDKPKNAIGMTKGVPAPEMEKLLLDNTKVNEADLRSLANSRAQAVRNWLTGQGKIPAARIFVLESRLGADAGKQPAMRVDFSLK
ncbi:DUF748 domain-containing protein [Uliginosibacterium sp. H3]|uniref:DUF748 domain-containing protein n=1 Tax=Uliginosibacterium silvisoli TaxID=3114758 RepID=A0ABU6K5V3_9RHOO|nr:DUF748 domain-containing protein [Uliginosibacterium sp. H3]